MTMLHVAAAALLLLQAAPAKKPAAPAQKAPAAAVTAPTDLTVTLTYKGKGTVDESHKLLAWLFTDATVTNDSRPVATMASAKNGATLTFKNVPATPVYVFAAYDQKGGYDGLSGPPPPGIPTAMYRAKADKGSATPLKAGAPPVALTFDDSHPWK